MNSIQQISITNSETRLSGFVLNYLVSSQTNSNGLNPDSIFVVLDIGMKKKSSFIFQISSVKFRFSPLDVIFSKRNSRMTLLEPNHQSAKNLMSDIGHFTPIPKVVVSEKLKFYFILNTTNIFFPNLLFSIPF